MQKESADKPTPLPYRQYPFLLVFILLTKLRTVSRKLKFMADPAVNRDVQRSAKI